jgi:tetratricopeptide (TPR) repeat protein
MSERERYRTRGEYYIESGNWQKCVEEYGELVKRYPVDNAGHTNAALCYSQLRNWPKAVDEAKQDVDIHADAIGLANLGLFSSYAGDFQNGERTAQRLLQLSPSFEYGYYSLAFAQLGQDQFPKAADTYRKLATVSALGASRASIGLADIDTYEGRFAEAVKSLTQGAAADVAAKRQDSAADKFVALAYTHLLLGQKPAAVAAAEKALANSKGVKVRFLAARTYVEAGELPKAQKIADSLAAEIQPEPQAYAKILAGEAALKRGSAGEAVKNFTDANNVLDTWIGRFDLGRAYLEAGAFTEADSEFDRCIKRRGETLALFLDEVPTFSYFPAVYYYQGRVREGLKSPGFADSYRSYLNIRGKSTDDPLVAEIHKRIGQ